MVRKLEYERINKRAVGGTTVLLADDRGWRRLHDPLRGADVHFWLVL